MYDRAFEDISFITPQKTLQGHTNTYWTYTVKCEGRDWFKIYNAVKDGGGDGFYGDGKDTFEVGVLTENGFTRKFFNDDIEDDVRGWLSKSEVTKLIKEIKKSA